MIKARKNHSRRSRIGSQVYFLVNHLLSQREGVRAVRESLPDAKFLSTDLQFPRGVYIVSKIARQQLIRQEEIALFGSWFTGN